MPKIITLSLFSLSFLLYCGFAFDLFYSHSVYDFDSCVAYSTASSTGNKGECLSEDGVIYTDQRSVGVDIPNEDTQTVSATSSQEQIEVSIDPVL